MRSFRFEASGCTSVSIVARYSGLHEIRKTSNSEAELSADIPVATEYDCFVGDLTVSQHKG